MRIIAVKTLKQYYEKYPIAEQAILAWYQETEQANWDNSSELKIHYKNASIITNKRVIFNICGNKYCLIVDIKYKLKIVFIVWFGPHSEYDKINIKTLNFKSLK